ncbi:DUF29 family protein [uncultured Hymenobacter sp.]|uniref:DUF29 family protein n=1 Tax=uncultured Hymenobacter sp. TaxID=170016 RepID=UPI0035C95FFF
MEELMEMRELLETGRYSEALVLLGELEEMSKDEKINKIESFLQILLLHLIKQHAEKRSTRSWDASIRNSVSAIYRSNKRRKAGGYYLMPGELREAIMEVYEAALTSASLEAFEGQYTEQQLAQELDSQKVQQHALTLLLAAHPTEYQ